MGDCSFRHCQSLPTLTSIVIHPAKLKAEKRPVCKHASYLARNWDLLIAYYYFKSGLSARIHLALEYSLSKKSRKFYSERKLCKLVSHPVMPLFCAGKNNIPIYNNDIQAKLLFLL